MLNDVWKVRDLPASLLSWLLGQGWCLRGPDPFGVLTICWAMHPDQREWVVDELPAPPAPMTRTVPLRVWKHVFRVDHEKREIVWVGTEEPIAPEVAADTPSVVEGVTDAH